MSEAPTDPETTTGEEETGEQPEAFANRAERRAKGKKAGRTTEVFSKGQPPTGRGSVQSPRQYGNRRSG